MSLVLGLSKGVEQITGSIDDGLSVVGERYVVVLILHVVGADDHDEGGERYLADVDAHLRIHVQPMLFKVKHHSVVTDHPHHDEANGQGAENIELPLNGIE